MKVIIAALVAFTPVVANAEPVHLRCQFDPAINENGRAPMNVTLNENEGTVTWTFDNIERVFTGRAYLLTPPRIARVGWRERESGSLGLMARFCLRRDSQFDSESPWTVPPSARFHMTI